MLRYYVYLPGSTKVIFWFAAICALLAPLKVPVPNGVTLIHNFDDFKSYCERGAL